MAGDSSGATSFWDGNTGTLIASFREHEADVLTLDVSSDGNSAFSSGIDSKVTKFQFTKVNVIF